MYAKRHQAGTSYSATGHEIASAVGWKMYALALHVEPVGLLKRLLQSLLSQLSSLSDDEELKS